MPPPPAPPSHEPKPSQGSEPVARVDAASAFEEARQADLYRRHLRGDRAALEELLVSIEPRLHALCLRMTGDPQDARDMVQEAMVKIIQGLPSFGGRSRLSTWMIRIAMNVCLTSRRRKKVRRTASLDSSSGRGGSSPSGGGGRRETGSDGQGPGIGTLLEDRREPAAEQRVEDREQLARLAEGISLMEPEQRALVILRDAQNLEYGEIADILGVPVGTIKSRLFRARQALRALMDGKAAESTDR